MRLFYKQQSPTAFPHSFIKQVIENDDGSLEVTVFGNDCKKKMDEFLGFVKTELHWEYHKDDVFTYSCNEENSFIIKPIDPEMKNLILDFFSMNNLMPPREQLSHSP